MDSAFIHQAANELVQNAGTRNIKQIARRCSLDISETSRIKDMLGLLSLYFDKPLILITIIASGLYSITNLITASTAEVSKKFFLLS